MTYNNLSVCCIECKEVKQSKGLFTHILRKHGTSDEKEKFKTGLTESDICKIRLSNYDKLVISLKQYYTSPKICKHCNNDLDWFSRKNSYCSQSCSTKQSNSNRIVTDDRRDKTSKSLKKAHAIKKQLKEEFFNTFIGPLFRKQPPVIKKQPKKEIVGAFTKVYFCICKFCKDVFTEKTVKQICDPCKLQRSKKYVDYRFKFNVYDYPDLFDLGLLKKIGWYSPKGKSGKWNPEGLSRDHKVSVNEALKYGHDPYYITHPMNCELMPHKQNIKKKTKSSLSYEDLVSLVDRFDKERAHPTVSLR